MEPRGLLARWRARLRAAWPAMRDRIFLEGGLRSVLVLVVAIGQGLRADALADAAAPAGALAFGLLSLLMAPPRDADDRVRTFIVARLSEPGTFRSLAVLVLGIGQGVSATTLVESLEAVAILVLGAVSAAQPAQAAKPAEEVR